MNINRGDILLANFEPVKGSEQGKTRPCLVIQNNLGNKASTTTIVASITSNIEHQYPFTVFVKQTESDLPKDSLILLNQLRTISVPHKVVKKLGILSPSIMKKVDDSLKISLGLD